jgi:hypothetical protein
MIPRTSTPTVRVVIAVLTFRRPHELRALLPQLTEQAAQLAATNPRVAGVRILVVDNDPDGSAQKVMPEFETAAIDYVAESTPGIAAARNRALVEAATEDLLIFIDDDERPHDRWLELLVMTYDRFEASVVAGAVTSEFTGELDAWIAAGGFFQRRRPETGTPLSVAATNNLLLDLTSIRSMNLRFDERFGLTGGEDTLFTRQLAAAGAVMVWCNEAIVTDRVPLSRMTRQWVLRRALSSGNSWALTAVEIEPTWAARTQVRIRLVGSGSARLTGGGARMVLGTLSGSIERQARGARTSARGLGILLGVVGIRHQEYRRRRGVST